MLTVSSVDLTNTSTSCAHHWQLQPMVIPRKLYTHFQQVVHCVVEHHLMLMHQWSMLTEKRELLKPTVRHGGLGRFIKIVHAKLQKNTHKNKNV